MSASVSSQVDGIRNPAIRVPPTNHQAFSGGEDTLAREFAHVNPTYSLYSRAQQYADQTLTRCHDENKETLSFIYVIYHDRSPLRL